MGTIFLKKVITFFKCTFFTFKLAHIKHFYKLQAQLLVASLMNVEFTNRAPSRVSLLAPKAQRAHQVLRPDFLSHFEAARGAAPSSSRAPAAAAPIAAPRTP